MATEALRAWSWRHGVLKSTLPGTTRHLLLTLSCHVNDAGEPCYPTVETLVEETGLSKRAVLTHLDVARQAGWIEVKKHGFGDRRWARNEYRILWPETEPDSERGGARGAPPHADGGAPRAPMVVHDVHHHNGHHIYKDSQYILNTPLIPPKGGERDSPPGFERWWQAWPASVHKKRKAECVRIWQRAKLDREAEIIIAHTQRAIVGSVAAQDGGRYLESPKTYLTNAAWREPPSEKQGIALRSTVPVRDAGPRRTASEGGDGFVRRIGRRTTIDLDTVRR